MVELCDSEVTLHVVCDGMGENCIPLSPDKFRVTVGSLGPGERKYRVAHRGARMLHHDMWYGRKMVLLVGCNIVVSQECREYLSLEPSE